VRGHNCKIDAISMIGYLGGVTAEIRIDGDTGDWRIIAPNRSARPVDRPGSAVVCPFCPGNEAMTPPEVLRWPPAAAETPASAPAGAPVWRVRVVPNLFAFVGTGPARAEASVAGGAFPATGQHEVLIESPHHDWDLRGATPDEAAEVLFAARERCRAMAGRGAAAVLAFRNYGRAAGNSLAHPHSQLVALDQAPPGLLNRWTRATEHCRGTGRRLHDDVADRERREGTRVVADESGVLVFQPWAASVPHETTLLPPGGAPDLARAEDDTVRAVAQLLPRVLAGLASVRDDPAYNLVIHAGPPDDPDAGEWYRWHITLYPRVTTPGGLEFATGLAVNPTAPEETAAQLRAALPGVAGVAMRP
jgi:UDPglucose--hexose-1-phosphate uridylyltransferase